MTEPLRIDALGADDRLLDALASRCYDGNDPLGGLLLSFAQACDKPSPTSLPRRRHSARRVVVSTFATAVFLASGASVAAAVTDHLPNGDGGWASSVEQWWNALPGLSGDQGDGGAAPGPVTSSGSPTPASSPRDRDTVALVAVPNPTAAVLVVSPEPLPGISQALPTVPSVTEADEPESPTTTVPPQPSTTSPAPTPSSSSPPSTPGAPTNPGAPHTPGIPATPGPPAGKGGNAPKATPGEHAPAPQGSSSGRPTSGRNVPAAMLEVLDLAPIAT